MNNFFLPSKQKKIGRKTAADTRLGAKSVNKQLGSSKDQTFSGIQTFKTLGSSSQILCSVFWILFGVHLSLTLAGAHTGRVDGTACAVPRAPVVPSMPARTPAFVCSPAGGSHTLTICNSGGKMAEIEMAWEVTRGTSALPASHFFF